MTPNLNLYGMLSDLGRGLGGIAEDERKRRMQAAIGGPLGQGDYGAAARAAFGSGDFDTGISLLKLGEATKLRKQQMEADAKALDFGGTQQPIQGSVTPGPQAGAMNLPGASLSNGKRIYDLAISKGADPREAALLASAAGAESNYNPAAVHDSGTGYGLFGHRLDRRDALFKFAGSRAPNEEQQVAFALQELRNRPEDAMARNARTPEDLARAQMFFERPKGFTEQTPEAGHNYSGRLALTRQFFPGQAGPQRVQVADASGRIPASAGVSGDVTAAPAMADTSGLQARLDDLNSRLLRPGLSDDARQRLQAAANAVQRQIDRADKQSELSLRREERQIAREQHQADIQAKREATAVAKAPTGEQANAATFATRMFEADKILSNPDIYGSGMGARGMALGVASSIPVVGNALVGSSEYGEKYQQYEQAKRDFVNAVLRKESGAAISAPEFANAEKQYFPQPGDKPKVIEQKAKNRATAIETIAAGGTPAFQKEFAQKRGGPKDTSKIIGEARDAIARGAKREDVIRRLLENNIDASGL